VEKNGIWAGRTKAHHKIEFVGTLEGELQRDDEWVVDEGQNGSLCQNMCYLSRS